ncbi:MAG TPA: sulfatase-like hydrolase/transferase [Polyangiaceae bacterium]
MQEGRVGPPSWRRFAFGVLAVSAGLALLDVSRACFRAPEAPGALAVVGSWLGAWGTILTLAGPLLGTRFFLSTRLGGRAKPFLGAFDGFAFGAVGLLLEDMATVAIGVRVGVSVALSVVGALAGLVMVRRPRHGALLLLLIGFCALGYGETLAPRQTPWLRFALDVLSIGTLGAAWARTRLPAPTLTWSGAVGVLVVAVGHANYELSRAVRGFLFDYAPHAQTFHFWSSEAARPLGAAACQDKAPETPSVRTRLSGGAANADVLIVSFDAMRWDHASSIPEVWNELRPAVRFSRAVAPAPRTTDSFPALFRGIPSRLLPTGAKNRALTKSAQPTLAEVLVARGYRAVQVPTHRYFEPSQGLNTGFELAFTSDFGITRTKRGNAYPIIRADAALARALEIARTTEGPLFLWVHLMEGHEPYRWRGGEGPATKEAQLRAYHDLDRPVAAFIREFRALRKNRESVVAVFGDHGEEFGEHGGRYHSTTVYAEQVRAALAIHAKGFVERSVDRPVSHAALPATILDLLGFPVPPSFREPSLLGCIENDEQCPRVAVSQMVTMGRSVGYTFERYRLLVEPRGDVLRLFDSDRDPLEKHDLAPAEPALLETLAERARAFDRAYCIPSR